MTPSSPRAVCFSEWAFVCVCPLSTHMVAKPYAKALALGPKGGRVKDRPAGLELTSPHSARCRRTRHRPRRTVTGDTRRLSGARGPSLGPRAVKGNVSAQSHHAPPRPRASPPPSSLRYRNKPFLPQRKMILILQEEGRGAVSGADRERESGGEPSDRPLTPAISLNRVVGFSGRALAEQRLTFPA